MKEVIPKLPVEERVFWAGRPFTPREVLFLLADDDSEEVRMALAENPACPEEVLYRLSQDREDEVRARAVMNPSAPPNFLALVYMLEKSGIEKWLLRPLALNPSTPAYILEELTEAGREYEYALAENPGAPPELLQKILERNPYLEGFIVSNPSTPLDLLLELVGEDPGVAKDPSLTEEERMRRLSKCKSPEVLKRVGRNPATPKDVLEALSRHPIWSVQEAVASNPATPKEIIVWFAKRRGYGIFNVTEAAVLNPSCPLEVLVELDMVVALENPSLSLDGLIQLILGRLKRRGELEDYEAYKLLPLLDRIPNDPSLWLAIWEALDKKGRKILEEHPKGRGMLLLARLGR